MKRINITDKIIIFEKINIEKNTKLRAIEAVLKKPFSKRIIAVTNPIRAFAIKNASE